MADKMLIDGLIKFCDEKSKNIKLKAEPQVFIEIKQALEELKELRKGIKEIPIATIKISKEDMQKIVDEKVAQIELDIQKIRAKAIDGFAERMKDFIAKNVEDAEMSNDLCCEINQSEVDEIAEQLKAGGVE